MKRILHDNLWSLKIISPVLFLFVCVSVSLAVNETCMIQNTHIMSITNQSLNKAILHFLYSIWWSFLKHIFRTIQPQLVSSLSPSPVPFLGLVSLSSKLLQWGAFWSLYVLVGWFSLFSNSSKMNTQWEQTPTESKTTVILSEPVCLCFLCVLLTAGDTLHVWHEERGVWDVRRKRRRSEEGGWWWWRVHVQMASETCGICPTPPGPRLQLRPDRGWHDAGGVSGGTRTWTRTIMS